MSPYKVSQTFLVFEIWPVSRRIVWVFCRRPLTVSLFINGSMGMWPHPFMYVLSVSAFALWGQCSITDRDCMVLKSGNVDYGAFDGISLQNCGPSLSTRAAASSRICTLEWPPPTHSGQFYHHSAPGVSAIGIMGVQSGLPWMEKWAGQHIFETFASLEKFLLSVLWPLLEGWGSGTWRHSSVPEATKEVRASRTISRMSGLLSAKKWCL